MLIQMNREQIRKKIFINRKFTLEDFKPSLPLNGKLIKTPELIKTVCVCVCIRLFTDFLELLGHTTC